MSRADRWIIGVIISLGALLPWATGAGVKLYLQAHDQPSLPWSRFLSAKAILVEIPLTLFYAGPFLILALVARAAFRGTGLPFVGTMSARQRRATVLASFGVGAFFSFMMWGNVWWDFDPLLLATPLVFLVPTTGMAIGWTIGLAAVLMVALWRKLRQRHSPRAGSE